MLIATQNILYQNKQYERGDVLPNYDPNLTKAWLESGSAIDKADVKAAEVTETPAASVEAKAPEEKPVKNTARKKK